MRKNAIAILISFMLCAVSSVTAYAENASLNIEAKSAILMEQSTGRILYEQDAHTKLAPASVTKVMTILLIYEAVEQGKISWDDMVTVSANAAGMGGSQIFLAENEQQSVRDLTRSIVIASANDAAVAMAEFISGNVELFAQSMNERAASLGMANTNFVNACGLDDPNHYTTAYDIALMSRELMVKHPGVKEFTTVWMDTITHRTSKGEEEFGLTNTNRLIRWYEGITGLKTGSTGEALYCLAGTAERDNMGLIAVVLAAPSPNLRFLETARLLDHGFANYAIVAGEPANTEVGSVRIFKGTEEEVTVAVRTDVTIVIPRDAGSELQKDIRIVDALYAPIQQGTKAGEIVYSFNGEEVGRSALIVTQTVDRAGIGTMLQRIIVRWFQ